MKTSEQTTELARAIAFEVRRLLNEPDAYLSKRDAAKYLTLSRSNLESRLSEIPHYRIGSRLLFRRSELDCYVRKHRVEVDVDHVSKIINDVIFKVKNDQKLRVAK